MLNFTKNHLFYSKNLKTESIVSIFVSNYEKEKFKYELVVLTNLKIVNKPFVFN